MEIKIKLSEGGIMPTRAHKSDAGLDLYSPVYVLLNPYGEAIVDTGVSVEIPFGFFGDIRSKSGLLFRHNLFTDGTIDSGYTGTVRVKIINFGDEPYIFNKGDKIAQMVISRCELPELVLAEELEETERGEKGFGSTGR